MKKILVILAGLVCSAIAFSQSNTRYQKDLEILKKGIKLNLDTSGTRYLKFTATSQFWVRFDQMNPGSTINGKEVRNQFDPSIRRLRFQFYGPITSRFFFYTQFGLNNFNFSADRKVGAFFHDAIAEVAAIKQKLHFGGGLSSWGGYSRYSIPSIGTTLGVDAPIFEQSTNDLTDQFGRKLGLYAKGTTGNFQYRVMVAKPFLFSKSPSYSALTEIGPNAKFSPHNPSLQSSAYIQWQFWDVENDELPFFPGTNLGSKKVLNIALGGLYQPKATWYKNDMGDTLYNNLGFATLSLFMDLPVKSKYNVSLYSALYYHNFGKNYLATVNPNRITNGLNANGSLISSHGNAFPIGTGESFYTQLGFDCKTGNVGRLGINVASYFSKLQRLPQVVDVYEAGLTYYPYSMPTIKVGLMVQNRPYFNDAGLKESQRFNSVILQFQVGI